MMKDPEYDHQKELIELHKFMKTINIPSTRLSAQETFLQNLKLDMAKIVHHN